MKELPERVRVFRGVTPLSSTAGLSWTLDREQALWFARRFGLAEGLLIAGLVRRERVLAIFHDRGEAEVIAFPEHVYRRALEPVPRLPLAPR